MSKQTTTYDVDGPIAFAAVLELERLTRRVNEIIAEVTPLVESDDVEPFDLTKDCGCVTHGGPHWLHTDRLWRERNRALLVQAGATTDPVASLQAYHAYLTEEHARLVVHARDMRVAKRECRSSVTPTTEPEHER